MAATTRARGGCSRCFEPIRIEAVSAKFVMAVLVGVGMKVGMMMMGWRRRENGGRAENPALRLCCCDVVGKERAKKNAGRDPG